METPENSVADQTNAPGTSKSQTSVLETPTPTKTGDSQGLGLPFNRVKKLMKMEGDVKAVTGEAGFVVARATELFLREVASRCGQTMVSDQRKLLAYKDVALTVQDWPALDFLKDVVPMKVPASVLIQQAQQALKNGENGKSEGHSPPA